MTSCESEHVYFRSVPDGMVPGEGGEKGIHMKLHDSHVNIYH